MTQRRRKRRSKAAAGFRWWILKRLLVPAGVLLAAGIVASIWYADRLFDVFEAREQQVSSRLLGRSYALTPGNLGSAGDLARRLDRLGYERARKSVTRPGTYTVWNNAVKVYLRQSRDAGGEHPARVAQVRFEDGRIGSVDRKDAFLEPETLSIFYGPEMEERELVEVSDCPKHLIDAIIAAEDRRFFSHPGIDPIGILRAAWANATSGSLSQGGSTLTQQLAKNLYFTDERSFTRKAKEALAAIALEARYSKQRLLRAYLNEVYLGQRGPASIRGVGRAARYYFGKPVGNLDLAESALLAGLIQTPGRYNPFMHPEAARNRRNIVLKAMEETGAITPEQRRATAALPVRVVSPGARGHMASAAYVSEEIRNELVESYGSRFWQKGLAVRTSIDPLYQEAAEKAVDERLARLAKDYRSTRKSRDGKPLQAALVSVDLHDGSILALVGGRDFALSQFNRATTARRQPGSLFKPVVYMAGLTHPPADGDEGPGWLERFRRRWSSSDGIVSLRRDREVVPVRKKKHHWWSWGEPDDDEEEVPEAAPPTFPLTAASILYDEPYQVESGGKLWTPQNYDHEFRGRVTVQEALEESLNVPTARAAAAIGLDRVVETAHALGIRSPIQAVPSIALGTADVTPLEMATAFATIADDGKVHEPFMIRGIQDESGTPQSLQAGWPYPPAPDADIAEAAAGSAGSPEAPAARDAEATALVTRKASQLMTALLEGVMIHGTGQSAAALGFDGTAAGKTGTSDDGRDLWFCGYTPDVLTLVWVGFDDATPTHLTGAAGALPIWVDYMTAIGAGTSKSFEGDDHLLWAPIDPTNGLLAGRSCPGARYAPFIPGTEPVMRCTEHQSFWDRWRD